MWLKPLNIVTTTLRDEAQPRPFSFKTEMNEDKNTVYQDMFIEYALSFRSTSEDFVLISLYLFLRH